MFAMITEIIKVSIVAVLEVKNLAIVYTKSILASIQIKLLQKKHCLDAIVLYLEINN